jgi:hypothetical protein
VLRKEKSPLYLFVRPAHIYWKREAKQRRFGDLNFVFTAGKAVG